MLAYIGRTQISISASKHTFRGQGRESRHEEVQSWEWDHVDCQLAQISIQLARETQARCYTRHCNLEKNKQRKKEEKYFNENKNNWQKMQNVPKPND